MIIAVVQARMGSHRLPGKSLLPLMGEPLVAQVLRSTQHLNIHKTVLATSNNREDDLLEYWGKSYGVDVVRGEGEDVLGRFGLVMDLYDPDYVVRICGDSPCIDTDLTNELIRSAGPGYDYVGYEINGSPAIMSKHGVFAEVVRGEALRDAMVFGHEYYREHVTTAFWMNPEKFNLRLLPVPDALSGCCFKTSIDNYDDYFNVVSLVEYLGYIPHEWATIVENAGCVPGGGVQKYDW